MREAAHTIPLVWPGSPEEMLAYLRETQAALFHHVIHALSADQLAQASAEMQAALRQYYDGQQVTIPAQVISGTGLRSATG